MLFLFWMLGLAAKGYPSKRLTGRTPPQFDPASFQYSFVQAMDRYGLQYRGVVTDSFEQMVKIWKKDRDLKESFCIEGLKDPWSEGVHDINVKFANKGSIDMGFASSGEGVEKKSSVIIKLFVGREETN